MKNNRNRAVGFSLIELMLAMAVFLIVAGAAFSLFNNHVRLYDQQLNATGLNISMRNAVSQMQIDVVNAGSGYYAGINIPSYPSGIFVTKGTGGSCNSGPPNYNYAATCFDILKVFSISSTAPVVHPTAGPGGATSCQSSTSSILNADAGMNPDGTPLTLQQTADFFTYDPGNPYNNELLLIEPDGSMVPIVLTSAGQVTGGKVQLQHNPTGADGTINDPFGIGIAANDKINSTFCNDGWILKIGQNALIYSVDATDPKNPKLMRNGDVVAEQIIGFKVGVAMKKNDMTDESTPSYYYDPATYPAGYISLIRSVRVTVIGRTPMNYRSSYRNTFDGGPYQIEAQSVVINPRGLSMRD